MYHLRLQIREKYAKNGKCLKNNDNTTYKLLDCDSRGKNKNNF